MQTRFIHLFSCCLAMLLCVGCSGDTPVPSEPAVPTEALLSPDLDSPSTSSTSPTAPTPELAFTPAPPVPQGPPRVEFNTSLGKIVIELDDQAAPGTVANFLEYVDSGHYDDTLVHQIWEGYIALTGGYGRDLELRPTRAPIRNEAHNGLKNERGTIAMARDFELIDSSTSQFFFNLADNSELNHQSRESSEEYGYCVFGRVVEGLDILDRISHTSVRDTAQFEAFPAEQIVIKSARRIPGIEPVRQTLQNGGTNSR